MKVDVIGAGSMEQNQARILAEEESLEGLADVAAAAAVRGVRITSTS